MKRPLTPGVQVSWTDALGNARFGTVDEIDESGRIYIAEARTNNRGRVVVSTCWFDAHETDRLTAKPASIADLIERSSLGAAMRDIKKRGIDAHLADLGREMTPKRRRR